jgi:hypothetical protein
MTFNSLRVDIHDSDPPIPAVDADKISKSTHHIPAGKTDLGPDWAWPFAAWSCFQHRGRILTENRATGAVYSFVLPLFISRLEGLDVGFKGQSNNSGGRGRY